MNKAVFQGIIDVCKVHAERLRWSMSHYKAFVMAEELLKVLDHVIHFSARYGVLKGAL